jgi:hypothetical protein
VRPRLAPGKRADWYARLRQGKLDRSWGMVSGPVRRGVRGGTVRSEFATPVRHRGEPAPATQTPKGKDFGHVQRARSDSVSGVLFRGGQFWIASLGPAQPGGFPELLGGEGVNGLHCAERAHTHSPTNCSPRLACQTDSLRKCPSSPPRHRPGPAPHCPARLASGETIGATARAGAVLPSLPLHFLQDRLHLRPELLARLLVLGR